ncbi:LLM class flavin-dependent oxidoreductase [Pseudonocardia bannensis]|uniref:LLM class flavin-dependent oxidoreductase n=1 Tax=Pseudonocardia bannensis TaxID=630973 RepID=A0A848DFG8_9PSEU|nr:LLM class flavin-dependent oxidoreductase [Pseudonocardia bannensis]NMH91398.1 LLM class flavin-dependent oxidoreductase [Pseudonocardia bannensis]
MPYAHLPDDHEKYDSLWVDFPNSMYDPKKGHALYRRYLSELALADRLGFDGLMINEHHSTVYSMMPAPNLIAGALIPQTTAAKLCVMGTLLNFSYPNRVAEEYAMLDVMSGGRLEVAFPLGTGMEYYSNATQINPATARERFEDAFQVVLKAWQEDGPIEHDGPFYSYRMLNPWPRPYQKPHPKVWFVGTGSPETIELATRYETGYASVFVPKEQQDRAYRSFRKAAADKGQTVTPDRLMFSIFCYVGETDEEAEREGKEHVLWYFNNALRTSNHYRMPPGYVSPAALRALLEAGPGWTTGDQRTTMSWEGIQSWRATLGSPETVANQIGRWLDETGAGRVLCHLHLGDMPHWKTVKNLTLFAEEVIPRLRGRVALAPSTAGASA